MRGRSLARRLAKRALGGWIWRDTYRCLRLPWRQAASPGAPAGEGIELRALERSELERYGAQAAYELSPRFLAGQAARDDLCFGAFAGGRLASYCFFALQPTDIDASLRFRFAARWIYVYKAFTHPAWRGRRLQQQVFRGAQPAVRRWLQGREPCHGFVTLVAADNLASLNAFARLGFGQAESFRVLRIRSRARLVSPRADERAPFGVELIDVKGKAAS